ncbi:MAG: purine-nucleoside phosphorylase [Bacteroidales bacterium]|jgi:purine-nucleoside phosphorylase
MLEKINETTGFLKAKGFINPDAGVVLGTGLGGLTAKIGNRIEVDYREIPNFPVSTVEGHEGKLIYGDFGKKKIIAMKGRFHFYEGYGSEQMALPIRALRYLGIKCLFLSNAAGGVNPSFRIGDIMIITDHISLLPNPLVGPNDDRIGVRFPDMGEAYDTGLIRKAVGIAKNHGIKIRKGVYLSTSGPTFETRAEYRHFRIIGADAVGMSTTPEVIIAHHMNLPVFAVSIITDLGVRGKIVYTTHKSVLEEAAKAEDRMTTIMTDLIGSL